MTILDANKGFLRAGFDEDAGGLKLFDSAGNSLTGDGSLAITQTNPATGQTVIVGPDGLPLPVRFSSASKIAFIGDSISARAFGRLSSTELQTQSYGFLKWGLELSGQRLELVGNGNFAVSSTGAIVPSAGLDFNQQTDQALASGADYYHYMGGINDIISNSAAVDFNRLIAAHGANITKLLASGKPVFIGTIPPLNATFSGYSVARQSLILRYNDWLRQLAAFNANRGAILIDYYAAAVNPTSATGDNLSAPDGIHPSNLQAFRMGKEFARVVSTVVPPLPRLVSSIADSLISPTGTAQYPGSKNVLQNGLFTANASGLATAWTSTVTGGVTVTPTIEAHLDGYGNLQVLTCNASAAGTCVFESDNFASRLAVTDVLEGLAEIRVSNIVGNLRGIALRLRLFGNVTASYVWGAVDSTDVGLTENYTGVLRCPLNLRGSGLTIIGGGARLAVIPYFGGSGSAVIKIGRASVKKIDV